MGALPKKKHAKARTRIRKAAIGLPMPALVKCPRCQDLKFPHRVCPHCGYYRDREVVHHEEKK